jgi:4-hydroxy-2-oxoheptanedioate aldolase
MRENGVKQEIRQGKPSIGTWCVSGSPLVAEVLARSGIEWLTIEMEHSAIDYQQCLTCLYAIETAGIVPFVRVAWNDPMLIKRALDIGAMGVIVPNIDTASDAERAVRASRYAPDGIRGVGSARGQLAHGDDYYLKANDEVCVGVMIESVAAVENIDEIMQVRGVDLCFIGPNDLASSMGVPLGLNNPHPDHKAAVRRVAEAGKRLGVPVGIHCADAREAAVRTIEGFTWLAVASDLRLLSTAVAQVLHEANGGHPAIGDAHPDSGSTFY